MTYNKFNKKIYLKLFLLCFSYFLICYLFKLFVPHDELASSEAVFIGVSFPLFSIFMGIYTAIKIKKFLLPSLLWLVYAVALEVIFMTNGFSLACVFLFVGSSGILWLYYVIKQTILKKHSKKTKTKE